jgi:hypothetical protein
VRRQCHAFAQRERTAHVAPATHGVELGLRSGAAHALERVDAQRQAQLARQRPRQFQHLVVAALAQAAAVQRHGEDLPRQGHGTGLAPPQAGQHAPGGQVGAELEARFQPIQRPAVAERRPRRIPRRQMALALAAQRGGRGQRQGAAGATAPVARQFVAAVGAQIHAVRARRAAQQAAQGQQPAQQR